MRIVVESDNFNTHKSHIPMIRPTGIMAVRLGKLWVSKTIKEEVPVTYIIQCVESHLDGDWGEVPRYLERRNENHLKAGGDLLSKYHVQGFGWICVWSNKDRTRTKVVRPDEL